MSNTARQGLPGGTPGRRLTKAALIAAVAIAIAGCAGTTTAPSISLPTAAASGATSPSGASPSPAGSPAASAGASGSPTHASPSGGTLDLCPGEREPCELEAGTYSPSRTTPKMTFTLDEGWTGFRHYEDAFSVGKDDPAGLFLSMARDVKAGMGGTSVEPGTVGFEAFLGSVTQLQPEAAAPVTVGGIEGIQIDVVANADAGGLYQVEKDQYNLSAGQKARFIILEVEDTTVVFVFESGTEDDFDEVEAEVQPVLDSLTFE